MNVYETTAALAAATSATGSLVQTKGDTARGDSNITTYIVEEEGVGVDLIDGKVAIPQLSEKPLIESAGIILDNQYEGVYVGTNYSIVTSTPGINDGVDGQVFYVVAV